MEKPFRAGQPKDEKIYGLQPMGMAGNRHTSRVWKEIADYMRMIRIELLRELDSFSLSKKPFYVCRAFFPFAQRDCFQHNFIRYNRNNKKAEAN